ncbi:NlpC/P60 family protein [Geodermatophilus sp. URMC 64]
MPGTRATAPSARTRAATSGAAARPVLSAAEAQALRRLLAERAAAEGRPAPAAGNRPVRRTTAAGTATTRKPAARKPAARKPAARKPRTRAAREARRAQRRLTRRRWARRFAVTVSALAVPAVLALLLPAGAPHGATGPTDATSLALTAQTTLLDAAGRYRQLEQQVTQRRAELAAARTTEEEARARVATEQSVVGSSAADLYRSSATGRYPLLDLNLTDPDATAGALYRQALAARADEALEGAVVRAERSDAAAEAAAANVAAAEAALRVAQRRAAAQLADVRAEVDGLSTEVTLTLAGLSTPVAGPQQDRNAAALHRWQDYLARLDAAGIDPPSARELADPGDLPAGFSPALDDQGQPVPGVAWAVIGSSPVTVLPAETVAAVSSALSQLGKGYVAGATGPDTYGCGGFTAASWLLAGYALPVTPAEQWTTGAAVPVAQLQVGDLVVTDGGQDVGIYLGAGEVVGASAGGFSVAVRSLGADVHAVRATLPSPDQPNAALTPAAGMGACGAPLPPPGRVDPAWGGYANGRIPASALCRLGVAGHTLRCDAAASYAALSDAFRAAFGTPLCITDSYRSYTAQLAAYRAKPRLAAWPGTSNHGWALAVDLCGGVNIAGSPQWTWMQANAGRFGFVNPPWARPGAEKPEPWHWEFGVFD